LLFLKKILSYLFDVQLDTASTPLNPVLQLSLRSSRFYLTTTNAVYSFGDLYSNFLHTFKKLDFNKIRFSEVLVLGFGMGSVPYMLSHVFGQRFRCTGVEADEKIIEWATRYVEPKLPVPLHLHHGDAFAFVEKCSQKFDLIVVDIFLDDLVPSQFESLDFLNNAMNLLTENGLLLFNRLADTEAALLSTTEFYENIFTSVFPAGTYLKVDENWVLANRKAWD
jgi:spermidine synthase